MSAAVSELYDEDYRAGVKALKEAAPETADAYNAWGKAINGMALDRKTEELAALAASIALQCRYCIDTHAKKARAFGATPAEVAAVVHVAAKVRAGAALSYGAHALAVFKPQEPR